MRVLYVSKAMAVPAYRDKLRALGGLVELRAVVPERWGMQHATPRDDEPWLRTAPAHAHGHNHLHVYGHARRLLDESPVDLVHIDEEPYSAVTAQFARHCRRRRVPFLFFAWQNLPKRIPAPFRALRRYVFERAAGGIAGTADAAAVLRAWGYDGALAVIPQMGVDPARFRPDPEARAATRRRIGAREGDFVVGFGGRLVREKGVHLLLEAAAAVDGALLLFMGDGPERDSLERSASLAGAADRVRFAGCISSEAMPRWLPACDVLALPSLTTRGWAEQFGRILVEAMACGVAVVGSDSGEIPRVIGDAGLVVPRGDAPALRAALVRIMSEREERARLVDRGLRRTAGEFGNACIATRTVAFYRELMDAGRTA